MLFGQRVSVKSTYRNKTLAMVSALILVGIGGVSVFTLGLYRHEKLTQIRRDSRTGVLRLSEHLQSLLLLSEKAELAQINSSPEMIFAVDGVCEESGADQKPRTDVVNALYAGHFQDIEVTPAHWLRTLEFHQGCRGILAASSKPGGKPGARVVPSDIRLMVPYAAMLVPSQNGLRLVGVSMEGFEGAAGNVLFIADRDGTVLWSVDGQEYLKSAFEDTGLNPEALRKWVETARLAPGIADIGNDGLLAYAPVTADWTLFSLSYKPTLLRPVNYAITESLLLIFAVLFICLFFGKRIAESIVRPLAELRASADLVGKGKFDERFTIEGENEISSVKAAFNVMIDKIQALIRETQAKSELESELRTVERVHRMLFPAKTVRMPEHGIHSTIQQATICGGDWWGYLEIPRKGRPSLLLIVIGDVTGHGTESALVTAAARGALSMLAQQLEAEVDTIPDPKRVLRQFNRAIFEAAGGALAMTFFVAVLDLEQSMLHCSNAGHNRPYLIEGGDKLRVNPIGLATSAPLGYAADSVYDLIETHPWKRGFKLVLYTDGLTDSEQFGRNKLRKAIVANAKMSSRGLLNKLMQEHRAVTGAEAQKDDITLVICEAVEEA